MRNIVYPESAGRYQFHCMKLGEISSRFLSRAEFLRTEPKEIRFFSWFIVAESSDPKHWKIPGYFSEK